MLDLKPERKAAWLWLYVRESVEILHLYWSVAFGVQLSLTVSMPWTFMEPNHLTVSQNKRNTPGLFGKLVLWNRHRSVRSQKTHKLIYDLLSVWTKEIKVINIFSIASYCIESHCVESNLIEIESHCIVIGVNRIASLATSCIFNVSYRWLCIEICITSASVIEMHIPTTRISPTPISYTFTFSHLADAFIQSDLQLGST